jgi:hypothetical protein
MCDTKFRKCLHCDKSFKSDGPANRICKKCKSFLYRRRNIEDNHIVEHYRSDLIEVAKLSASY